MNAVRSWVGIAEFAARAGIGRRAATAAANARLWRGHTLDVRQSKARGGRSGAVYEVSLRSLLAALSGPRASATTSPSEGVSALALLPETGDSSDVIHAAVVASRANRAHLVAAYAERENVSIRTAYRRVSKVGAEGHVGLQRKPPKNKGERRVAISRAFSAAWEADGRDPDEAHRFHDRVAELIAGMWCGQHANAGARRIARDASRHLRTWCAEAGFQPKGVGSRKLFTIPRRMAEAPKGNAVVNRMKTDARAHYNASPYRTGDLSLLLPMQVLMGDVHSLDWRTARENGKGAYCTKLIAWMDVATRRVWATFKTCEEGEAVKKLDVNASLASVFKHPDWGSPDYLHVDNGKEYGLRDGLSEPMRLAAEKSGRAPLIRSIPHNARGKGLIEGFFGRLEHGAISLLPGYGGGDRMRAKTANQGREIAAFEGTPALAEAILSRLVELYNDEPQEPLDGLSPNEAFAARRAERETVTWSIEALAYALADRREATNQRGRVRFQGQDYELHGRALPAHREKVTVLHGPFISGGVMIEFEGELTFAEETPVFAPYDQAGAKYSGRRRREFDAETRKRGVGLPVVNPLAEAIDGHRPTLDLLEAQKGVVRIATSPKARQADADREAADRRQRDDRIAENIARAASNAPAPRKIA